MRCDLLVAGLAALAACGVAAADDATLDGSRGALVRVPSDQALSPAPTRPPEAPASRTAQPEVADPCPATVADLPPSPLFEADDPRLNADTLVVVHKAVRRLIVFEHGGKRACYRVGLGFAPTGPKRVRGDGKTPEGWYRTSDRPWSAFADAIAVHYPNARDAALARSERRISAATRQRIARADARGALPPQATTMGGQILVHGEGADQIGRSVASPSTTQTWRLCAGSCRPRMRTRLLIVPE